MLILCSSLAWSTSGSIGSCSFCSWSEEGMANLSLGQHSSWEPLIIGISCQHNCVWASSPCSPTWVHFILLEPSQIWSPLNSYSHCHWFDTYKMMLMLLHMTQFFYVINFVEEDCFNIWAVQSWQMLFFS